MRLARKEHFDSLGKSHSVFGLAFPDDENFPVSSLQRRDIRLIALNVAASLCLPKFRIFLWFDLPVSAIVHVPEAAMDKNDLAATFEDEIRGARQTTVVEAVPEAQRVRQ